MDADSPTPTSETTPPRKRRWKLGLRGLIVVVLILGSWLGITARHARTRRLAVEALTRNGGWVRYDYQHSPKIARAFVLARNTPPGPATEGASPVPAVLLRWFGVDFFHAVEEIGVISMPGKPDRLAPIRDLPNLLSLVAEMHAFSDAVLAPLSHLRRLRSLSLCYPLFIDGRVATGRITDAGMVSLRPLTNLEYLDVSRQPIGDLGAACFRDMTRLKTLKLSFTKITDVGLDQFARLKELEVLDLSGTEITNAGLAKLQGFPRLRKLQIGFTAINDEGLMLLAGMGSLESLELSGPKITDAGIPKLKAILGLRELNLSNTAISTAALIPIADLVELRSLDLSGTRVNDQGLKALGTMKSLKSLSVRFTPITVQGARELQKSTNPELSVAF